MKRIETSCKLHCYFSISVIIETVEQLLQTIDEETQENFKSCSLEVIFLYLIECYD